MRSIVGIALSVAASTTPAQAESTVSFSGYVAPACMVMTIEDDRLLPRGANRQDYLLLRCNTGAPDRVIRRDDRSSQSATSLGTIATDSAVTIVP